MSGWDDPPRKSAFAAGGRFWKWFLAAVGAVVVAAIVFVAVSPHPSMSDPPARSSFTKDNDIEFDLQTALNTSSVNAFVTHSGFTVRLDTDLTGARETCSIRMLQKAAAHRAFADVLRAHGFTRLGCEGTSIYLDKTW